MNFERFSVAKMSILPKLTNRFSKTPVRILAGTVLVRTDKLLFKTYLKK